MALSSESESVLESAMKKITGEPGANASSAFRPAQLIPENVIGYGTEFGDHGKLGTVSGPVDTVASSPAAASPAATPAAPDPFLAQLQGLQAQTAALQAQAAGSAAPAAAAPQGPPSLWKSYDEYWADKGLGQQAKGYGGYNAAGTDTSKGKWGPSGDPYRWTTEYGKYLDTLPAGQRATAKAGVGADWVRSGVAKSVYTGGGLIPIEGADYYWQNPAHQAEYTASQQAKTAAAPTALTAPVRPTGRNVSWQADQQYWRDMDAYRKAGGK